MAELKSKGVQGSKLVGDATNEGSIGLNTASGASDFVTGHLYWKKNLLGDSLIENAVVSHASLEFVFGRYGLDTTTYNPALPDTAGQAVLACFRGDGRTAAGTKISTPLFGEAMGAAALDAAWLWMEHVKSAGTHQLKLYIAPSNPVSATPAILTASGPVIQNSQHEPDFAQHVVIVFEPSAGGYWTVTLFHNGQPGVTSAPIAQTTFSHFMLNNSAGFATDAVLFGPCLTPPTSRSKGYYFDSIAYYPTALTTDAVVSHFSTLFEGVQIPGGTGTPQVLTRELRFTFVPATDNNTLGLHKIAVSDANGDILTGATRTLPVGSWENTSVGWFGPGPSNAPFVVEYRLTDSVEVSSITDYQIGAGSNLGYSQMLTMGWTLEYKNAVGTWVELDTRSNITWTMRMLNTYIIGGGSSSLSERLGFDPASVVAPAELIGPDYSTLQLKDVSNWGIEYLSRGGQLRGTHTTGKWYFEITVDDIMIPNDAQYPRAIEVTVNSGASYATGVDSASVRYEMDSDGSINRIVYIKHLSILGQVITWFANRPDIDIAPLSTAGKTICVLVDMSGSRANVAIGERSATGQPVKWFDGTTMTSTPVSMASTPVWWAKSLDKSVQATARVQITNMQATVRVNSGETAPIFAVPTGTYGWGLTG